MYTVLRKASYLVFAAAALAAATPSAARADDVLRARVPFPFIVNNVRMPAGDYVVRDTDQAGVLQVATADGHATAYIVTIPAYSVPDRTTPKPTLTFSKFASEYFLSGVNPDDGVARAIVLTPGRMERELVNAVNVE